jgi:hypothetical protein
MRRSGELEYATEIGFGVTRIGAQPAQPRGQSGRHS